MGMYDTDDLKFEVRRRTREIEEECERLRARNVLLERVLQAARFVASAYGVERDGALVSTERWRALLATIDEAACPSPTPKRTIAELNAVINELDARTYAAVAGALVEAAVAAEAALAAIKRHHARQTETEGAGE